MDPASEVLWRVAAAVGDGPVLAIGVAPGPGARDLVDRLTVVDPWATARPGWADLARPVDPREDAIEAGAYAVVLVRPERQVSGRRGRLARALRAARPGGDVIACLPSREGGKRLAAELDALGAEVVDEDSKAHCRWVWARRPLAALPDLDVACADDAPRPVLGGAFRSRPGLFSWDEADPGSALLARSLPARLGATVADAGAGWGWLARQILDVPGRCDALHLIEADARALTLAVANLADHGPRLTAHHADAAAPWPVRGLDAVVSNPPFHRGGVQDVGLVEAVLRHGADALADGGALWVVAKRNVPLARLLGAVCEEVEEVAEADGYRVMRGVRAGRINARSAGRGGRRASGR